MKFFRQEQGAAGIEYVLVLGVVAVLALIMLTGFRVLVPQVVELLCGAVDTAGTSGSCVVS